MSEYTAISGMDKRCRHCTRDEGAHGYYGACHASRLAMYGRNNPIVRWLQEHAPREVDAPAETALDRWESDE